MDNQLAEMSEDKALSILEELEGAFFDIPFENSAFQTKTFVVAAQLTPGRAYRTLGLGMLSKIRTVQSQAIGNQRRSIKEKQLREKISNEELGSYAQQLLELDLQELTQGERWEKKLLNDALVDLHTMYTEFKKRPKYTRAAFEAEEEAHFTEKLTRDAKGVRGAAEALTNMAADAPNWDKLVEKAKEGLEKYNLLGK